MDATLSKIQPFAKRTILPVDTLCDKTGVVLRIRELGLRPSGVHDATDVDIDTIVVDSFKCAPSEVFERVGAPQVYPDRDIRPIAAWIEPQVVPRQFDQLANHDAGLRSRSSLFTYSALESNTVSPVSAPNNFAFDIVLAEDNLVNQRLAVKILKKYGPCCPDYGERSFGNGSVLSDADLLVSW
ncbi:hypothetical protein EST38_g14069 [Candolleomyces aberdarensis]|uniref:Uncharacterized protein n=1 Tax=Candolleomyces aberdarensis TaxID=2316362 RepID=A0A4Q2D034_9AGAR|nr:hypothetical protein EST38_g14069 [Candolleomyces aberdarensis]